jgi:NADPH:quinone reductase-like Zn-dependent oxidoreductase
MRAWVRQQFGGPEQLKLQEVPVTQPADGEVLIRVRALGINRAEIYFRKGLWGDVAPVSGIECVGEVVLDPSGGLAPGSKAAAFMGGMGRTRSGSYAEYVCASRSNVVPLVSNLPWPELAAIPESYATAWSCLFESLHLQAGDAIVIRGATSALGLAALHLARHAGATVVATTRSESKRQFLLNAGACHAVLESPDLHRSVRGIFPAGVNAVLDLVGNSTILDSMRMPKRHGRVCVAGFLGGAAPVSVDLLTTVAPGVDFTFFVSILLGTPEYPVSNIPLQSIVDSITKGAWPGAPAHILPFDQLPEAHRLMESNAANGKIVVALAP